MGWCRIRVPVVLAGPIERILAYQFEPAHVAIFFTLLYLEAVLSFDNAAVLAAMVRPLPIEMRRKALLYGLAGAYVFRITAILLAAFIIENPWLKLGGAAYLIWLPVKHWWGKAEEKELGMRKAATFFGLSVFWSTVVYVELLDIAFALDQVLVAVALTDEILIIIVASMTAIVFLRIAASYMSRIMDWFPRLEDLAYLAVGFVGLKLLYEEALHFMDACDGAYLCPVPRAISVGITFTLLVVPVVVKLVIDKMKGRPPTVAPPPQ